MLTSTSGWPGKRCDPSGQRVAAPLRGQRDARVAAEGLRLHAAAGLSLAAQKPGPVPLGGLNPLTDAILGLGKRPHAMVWRKHLRRGLGSNENGTKMATFPDKE